MSDYIFFSKSDWREAPRLRHQVARLIHGFGGKILFVQKPAFIWRDRIADEFDDLDDRLRLTRTHQLIHHQLRVFPLLRSVNTLVEKRSIVSTIGRASKDAVIINFNYDYYFLREIFPRNPIITIINDDFVAQSKFFSGAHVKAVLAKTCAISDAVLTVSYPLMQQLSAWCSPQLFFPWADVEYRAPAPATERRAVLLWAHIDKRVDFDLLHQSIALRSELTFYLVGPISEDVRSEIPSLTSRENVVFLPSSKLDDLNLDQFFAAVIPYKSNQKDVEAVSMSNKTLQLMSRGLPIITHGMPNFYEHPAIFNASGAAEFLESLDRARTEFSSLQISIADLVSSNQPMSRLVFIQNLVSEIKVKKRFYAR